MVPPPGDPDQKINFIAKRASTFSGWRNCNLNEDPWFASGHRCPCADVSLNPLGRGGCKFCRALAIFSAGHTLETERIVPVSPIT